MHPRERIKWKGSSGYVLKLVSLLHTKLLKRPINKGRAAVNGDCVNRGAVYD